MSKKEIENIEKNLISASPNECARLLKRLLKLKLNNKER